MSDPTTNPQRRDAGPGPRAHRPGEVSPAGSPSRLRRAMVLVGLVVGLAAACGIPARATYLAQVTADEPQYLLTADALARTGNLDIGPGLRAQTWRAFHHDARLPRQTAYRPGGQRLSPHDPLLPVILAGPMRVGGWAGAKAAMSVMAGLLAALLTWTAVRRFGVPVRPAALVVAGFGVVPPLVSYGTQIYPELPAALVVTAAIACITAHGAGATSRLRSSTGPLRAGGPTGTGEDRRPSRSAGWAVVGWVLAIGALPWLAVKYAPVAFALALVAFTGLARARRWTTAALAAGALALIAVGFLVFHQRVYGGWTVYAAGNHFAGGELEVMGSSPDYASRADRLVGLLTDRDFGLVAWAPAYLLAIPAVAAVLRRRPAGWSALALPLAAGWLNATFVALTMHGWWWPGRQVVVVLPAAVLATAWWVAHAVPMGWATRARNAFTALTAFGVLTWGWLLIEVALGKRTVIFDFAFTADPISRAWRVLLPDLRRHHAVDVALLGTWTVGLLAAAALGWRRAGPPSAGDEDAGAGEGTDADVAPVDLDRGGAVG